MCFDKGNFLLYVAKSNLELTKIPYPVDTIGDETGLRENNMATLPDINANGDLLSLRASGRTVIDTILIKNKKTCQPDELTVSFDDQSLSPSWVSY